MNQHLAKYGFGWAWMDVDRWGNSGGTSVEDEVFTKLSFLQAWIPFIGQSLRVKFGEINTSTPNGAIRFAVLWILLCDFYAVSKATTVAD